MTGRTDEIMNRDDVIAAFVDNEAFDAAELARALSEPGGRELLVDLLALRALVRDDAAAFGAEHVARNARSDVTLAGRRRRERQNWIAAGFLAASLLFAIGSALVLPPLLEGRDDAPPRPDRVITFDVTGD